MPVNLAFLGAAGTVTGAKFLLDIHGDRYLIDCGLFQGTKEWREKNWHHFPYPPHQLKAVILTHVHLDHCGYLPRLVKSGFRGPIYCTKATSELLPLMLQDSAYLQEEDARYANLKGYSKHQPAVPLYTTADVQQTLPLIHIQPYGEELTLHHRLSVRFHPNGHLLGSAWIECTVHVNHRPLKIYFSGDLGRYTDELMRPPVGMAGVADYVVVESTYGNRRHLTTEEARARLAEIINRTVQRGGSVVIPAFAVGRTSIMLYHIRRLEAAGLIPSLPVFVDSPMASDATELYARYGTEMNLQVDLHESAQHRSPLRCNHLEFLRSAEESKRLNEFHQPCLIISASGMAAGGRVLHHLSRRLPDPKHTVLLVGFQAQGTRGWQLQQGMSHVKIHGRDVPVHAEVATLDGFSAHGDQHDLLQWMGTLRQAPKVTFVVHGESEGLTGLAEKLAARGHHPHIPAYRDTITLS